jgi:hypothetical protein
VQAKEWKKLGCGKDIWIFIYHLNPNPPQFSPNNDTWIVTPFVFENSILKHVMSIGFPS